MEGTFYWAGFLSLSLVSSSSFGDAATFSLPPVPNACREFDSSVREVFWQGAKKLFKDGDGIQKCQTTTNNKNLRCKINFNIR